MGMGMGTVPDQDVTIMEANKKLIGMCLLDAPDSTSQVMMVHSLFADYNQR